LYVSRGYNRKRRQNFAKTAKEPLAHRVEVK
jgi:hypothetical protein